MAIRRAFEHVGITNDVLVANDGVEALDLLRSGQVPRPNVIFLDINMPRMNGIEFLAEVRADPILRDTIIFMLSTSDTPNDLHAAYAHLIAGYIVKEDAYRSIGKAAQMLEHYLGVVTLPQGDLVNLR